MLCLMLPTGSLGPSFLEAPARVGEPFQASYAETSWSSSCPLPGAREEGGQDAPTEGGLGTDGCQRQTGEASRVLGSGWGFEGLLLYFSGSKDVACLALTQKARVRDGVGLAVQPTLPFLPTAWMFWGGYWEAPVPPPGSGLLVSLTPSVSVQSLLCTARPLYIIKPPLQALSPCAWRGDGVQSMALVFRDAGVCLPESRPRGLGT